jgi:hypothetical protein
MRSEAKILQMRRGIERNPHKYQSNTPGGVQASASQPFDPHRKASLIFILEWDVVSLHPLGGAEEHKTTSFSLSMPVVCTLSASFFFFSCADPSQRSADPGSSVHTAPDLNDGCIKTRQNL